MNEIPVFLFLGIIFIWLGVLTFYLYRAIYHYNHLIKFGEKGNLTTVLEGIIKELELEKKTLEEIKQKVEKLNQEKIFYIQRIGFLRYNPFQDVGGEQSFVLAILDANNTGVVITSLHTRGKTRWYAKKVEKGKGVEHELSFEEKKAIKEAINFQKAKNE